MHVMVTELKTNFGKYLELIAKENFEDCLVATCAKSIHCDYIITRNKKDLEKFDIPVLMPAELLSQIS